MLDFKKKIKRLFCRHCTNTVLCWHWNHGINSYDDLQIEIQCQCNRCGKLYYRHIFDSYACKVFEKCHENTEWSKVCDSPTKPYCDLKMAQKFLDSIYEKDKE